MPADDAAIRAPAWPRRARAVGSLSPRREAQLITRARRGDGDAVEALFTEYWPMCHRTAWLITRDPAVAEDIAQEAFVASIAALDGFDRSRRLGPWLRTIVARRAIDHTRARTARRELDADSLQLAAAPAPVLRSPSDELLASLGRLGLDRRAVVVLRYFLELTPREIAAVLELPVGTVNSRLRRALDELRAGAESSDG